MLARHSTCRPASFAGSGTGSVISVEAADVVVRGRYVNQRMAVVPLEPDCVAAAQTTLVNSAAVAVPFDAVVVERRDGKTYYRVNSVEAFQKGCGELLALSCTSSRMISLHRSTHSSHMKTDGPAISLRTSCWLFPQKEQYSNLPPSSPELEVSSLIKQPYALSYAGSTF